MKTNNNLYRNHGPFIREVETFNIFDGYIETDKYREYRPWVRITFAVLIVVFCAWLWSVAHLLI